MEGSAQHGGQSSRAVALVTGASSGIGRDLAELLAEHGFDLVLVARNEAALKQVAEQLASQYGIAAEVLAADLADPGGPQRIFDQVSGRGLAVDVLVNNAGFGVHGAFADTDLAAELSLLQVNIVALTHLTKLFLPGMLKRGHGRILNVASMAGMVPGPYLNTYYASKAYVLSHSVALSRELRRSGVTVTVLCPGPTRTDFQRRAGMSEASLFRGPVMDSMTVAQAGYEGMMAGRPMVVPGVRNKLLSLGSRLLSRSQLARLTGKLNRNR